LNKDGAKEVKARYDRISPYYDLMELPLEKLLFSRWRRRVFDALDGDSILEVGVGTGKNFDFYPADKSITAIDFSKGMLEKARRKAQKKELKADLEHMDVEDLQFDDQSFDTVLATFVFCSVGDPIKGLQEVKRVCKRNGKVILLEHVRPATKLLGRPFDLLNPITVKLIGANINRNTVLNMKMAGLHVVEEENLFGDVVKLLVANP
jgi:phosphatidylethanolamine/phosphatidyl-N-methylethanolamine N-methyltransferase